MSEGRRGAQQRVAAVKDLFDRESRRWSRRYEKGGSMEGRVERFAAAVGARIDEGASVLDFGCGAGHIALALAARGQRVVGCDISEGMLEQARASDAAGSVEWVQLDPSVVLHLPFEEGRFDAATASSVLEYVDSPGAVLAELARVVRPGGWVIATVPDLRDPWRAFEVLRWRWVRWPWLGRLLKRTRLRDYVEYLLLSKNWLPVDGWTALVSEAGLDLEPVGACDGPLLLLRARKPAPAQARV